MTTTAATLTQRALELHAQREPFVRARVVLAERPTSAKPGAEAIVLRDGTIEGFVGGTCAEATVREQSLEVLTTGQARLVRITPDPEPEQHGKVVVHNECLSGGTLEIFLEPDVPTPLVVVVGDSPIARALVSLGGDLGYALHVLDGDLPEDASAVVVASHGRGEEDVLTLAIRAGIGYVGLVASPRRGGAVLSTLDLTAEERDRIDTPAGLDIGARTPAEVAVSILAGIIEARPRPPQVTLGHGSEDPAGTETHGTASDPVCGMTVATVAATLHIDHDGGTVWFCGSGCLRAFSHDPSAFPA